MRITDIRLEVLEKTEKYQNALTEIFFINIYASKM